MPIIDTPEGIAAVRLLTLIHALRVEVNTGMKVSPFPLTKTARQYGVTARTKKQCLTELVALYEQTTGQRLDWAHG